VVGSARAALRAATVTSSVRWDASPAVQVLLRSSRRVAQSAFSKGPSRTKPPPLPASNAVADVICQSALSCSPRLCHHPYPWLNRCSPARGRPFASTALLASSPILPRKCKLRTPICAFPLTWLFSCFRTCKPCSGGSSAELLRPWLSDLSQARSLLRTELPSASRAASASSTGGRRNPPAVCPRSHLRKVTQLTLFLVQLTATLVNSPIRLAS
jgi:hypothetical protein